MLAKKNLLILSGVVLLILLAVGLSLFFQPTQPETLENIIEESSLPSQTRVKKSAGSSPNRLVMSEISLDTHLDFDQIELPDPAQLYFDAFPRLREIQLFIEKSFGVEVYIQQNDLISAASILKSYPEDPDAALYLNLIKQACDFSDMMSPGSEAYDQYQRQLESPLISPEERDYFTQINEKASLALAKSRQSCHDLNQSLPIDIESTKADLINNTLDPLSQIMARDDDLTPSKRLELAQQLYQKEDSFRSQIVLADQSFEQKDPASLKFGLDLLLNSKEDVAFKYITIANCLQNRCGSVASDYPSADEFLKKAAVLGENTAFLQLSHNLEKQNNWEDHYAWNTFHYAMLRKGCFQSSGTYAYDYLQAKRNRAASGRHLTEQQRLAAEQKARVLVEKSGTSYTRALNCNLSR